MARRRERELRDLVEGVVVDFPGMTYRIEIARHVRIFLTLGGKSRFAIVPSSPSDHRGNQNNIMTIRRVAREISNDR